MYIYVYKNIEEWLNNSIVAVILNKSEHWMLLLLFGSTSTLIFYDPLGNEDRHLAFIQPQIE